MSRGEICKAPSARLALHELLREMIIKIFCLEKKKKKKVSVLLEADKPQQDFWTSHRPAESSEEPEGMQTNQMGDLIPSGPVP